MKKRLPIGISSFECIRTEGYYYVDKTPFVAKLVEEGKYYFLSRPRRFGKSLFVDTLKQAFLGRKELFEGLYLYEHWDWSKIHPVIHLDFAGGVAKDAEHLQNWILFQLRKNQQELDIFCEETSDYRSYFEELIIKTHDTFKQKVVVLIDEYDKPILDKIEEREIASAHREILKNLYSVLKPLDSYLKFVFITGVSKFSKVSLFSGLNQLQDITLHPEFAGICGYTQEELEKVFAEEIRDKDLEAIKCWYNGYSFCGEPVYNPFDVLLYLSEGQFRPFWFETGTLEFLIKVLIQKDFFIPELEEVIATDFILDSFDIDYIQPEALLFQTGYLTVRKREPSPEGTLYFLTYPNKEVRVALNKSILRYLSGGIPERGRLSYNLREVLRKGKLDAFREILRSLFSGIPYEWYKKNRLAEYEGYFASVVYSFLVGAGLEVIAEDFTSRGRIDLTVKMDEKVYVVEFKVVEVEGREPVALEALKERGYAEKYRSFAREIYLVGIDFSKRKRNILSFSWERL